MVTSDKIKDLILSIALWALVLFVVSLFLIPFFPYFDKYDETINYTFSILFDLWLLLSTIIFIYWHYRPKSAIRFCFNHEKAVTAVYIGVFILLFISLYLGIESILFFIPDSWVSYSREDGEYSNVKTTISMASGFCLAIFLAINYGELWHIHDKKTEKKIDIEIQQEVKKRKEHLQTLSPSMRQEKYKEYKNRANELRYKMKITYDEEHESTILNYLLEQLDDNKEEVMGE